MNSECAETLCQAELRHARLEDRGEIGKTSDSQVHNCLTGIVLTRWRTDGERRGASGIRCGHQLRCPGAPRIRCDECSIQVSVTG